MSCCTTHLLLPLLQGEYGLREAVQEIKKRKEEIAARDKCVVDGLLMIDHPDGWVTNDRPS